MNDTRIEWEVKFLEISEKDIINKLEEVGAVFVGEWAQIRNVYHIDQKNKKKWIRLRTNGEETTLAIKEIKSDLVDGVQEIEVTVSNFEDTNLILNHLGYVATSREENRRKKYYLDNVEIDIDTWPLIPSYLEIEGKDEISIKDACVKLGLDYANSCTFSTQYIYENIYKIEVEKIKNLVFQLNKINN
ncbi:MAG: CYTH domain-containing protein [Endomicrobium sp.]|jgi:adenylate cyclase class 2|uniref:class IV adenylate cyclase n=1 Tax=Candidatus Endomicrobiellum cubanum TaxID=3242325 RepID=UPI002836E485|nr:CYTH domain-containing protein [Endomicrobium sp.]